MDTGTPLRGRDLARRRPLVEARQNGAALPLREFLNAAQKLPLPLDEFSVLTCATHGPRRLRVQLAVASPRLRSLAVAIHVLQHPKEPSATLPSAWAAPLLTLFLRSPLRRDREGILKNLFGLMPVAHEMPRESPEPLGVYEEVLEDEGDCGGTGAVGC